MEASSPGMGLIRWFLTPMLPQVLETGNEMEIAILYCLFLLGDSTSVLVTRWKSFC
jgi:hypothetical protein